MYKIFTLICILAAALVTAFLVSWIKSRRGTGEEAARLYGIIKSRNANFWSFHYVSVLAAVIIVSAAVGAGIGWSQAAACLTGAVASFALLYTGSLAFVPGSSASFNEADRGDARSSVKASYRTGAVFGFVLSSAITACLLIAFISMKAETAINLTGSFALGTSLVAVLLHTGGDVYSSAYSQAVSRRDFTDRIGFFVGAGSDLIGSYVLAAAATIMLADVGVATSGVTSTFTAGTAARFVIAVYAAGIIGCSVGVFLQHAGLGSDLTRGADIGCIAAGVITIAITAYFSISMLQSILYAFAVGTGIVAGLVLTELNRFFANDSKIYINAGKNLGKHSVVVFNAGSGMITTSISAVIILVSIIITNSMSGFYGFALCTSGLCSILATIAALSGLSTLSAQTSDIISSRISREGEEDKEKMSDALAGVSVRNLNMANTYRAVAAFMSALAIFCVYAVSTDLESINILAVRVFCGIIVGACSAFVLTGMLISSVNITSRVALRDMGRSDDETGTTSSLRGSLFPAIIAVLLPTIVGLFFGPASLAGFLEAIIVTGCFIVNASNNSGRYLENTAIQSLSSVIRMITVFSVVFLPVFTSVGGFLF